jgi:AmpE protein
MEFLVILIVWAAIRSIDWPLGLQRDEWFIAWRLRTREAFGALPPAMRLLLICALPCLLVAVLELLLSSHWAGVPLFVLEVFVLLYSIGRGDYRAPMGAYLAAWQRGDYEAAYQEAVPLFNFDPQARIVSAADLHAQVRRGLLYLAFERWFAVIFWFYFLGPWAALFYRLLQLVLVQHSTDEDRQISRRWLMWIEWLPVRLLGLAFAVTGNFAGCFAVWRERLAGFTPVPDLVTAYADEALDGATTRTDSPLFEQRAALELLELDALVARSAIAWLVMFALLQLLR